MNWALFVSNWGRTAVHTLELYEEAKLPEKVKINAVVYQNTPSGAAEYADTLGIKTFRVLKENFNTRAEFEEHLLELMLCNEIDYIFLLAFSYLIKHSLLEKFQGKIINIHPSLLPSFRGRNAIQQAMDYGVKYSGMTTHFIDENLDKGSIISQLPIPFYNGDTFEEIDKRYKENFKKIVLDTFNVIMKY